VPFIKAAGELEDEALAAVRRQAARDRHPARRARLPHRPPDRRGQPPEALPLLQRAAPTAVFECRDVEHSIYELPLQLAAQRMDEVVVKRLGLQCKPMDITPWREIVRRLLEPKHRVRIGVVGKYIELQDAYKSVYESITHGGIAHETAVEVVRIDAEDLETKGTAPLEGLDGILVPGGFGNRGIEGKIIAAQFARERKVPYYGLCLGMQITVIEYARHVLGLKDAHSTEFAPETKNPVIHLMESQKSVVTKGGTMRLGSYDCALTPGSRSRAAYGAETIKERHRHRFEYNDAYRPGSKAPA
jgi:CTP synthase